MKYILAIDQSTQGTKAMLFDEHAALVAKAARPHKQIINDKGWVEHNPQEILDHVIECVQKAVLKSGINKDDLYAVGISNQRETVVAWDKSTGVPCYNAIVWQDSRTADICKALANDSEMIFDKTGIRLSPYFPAPKFMWFMQNIRSVKTCADADNLCFSTMDGWLIYALTEEKAFKTDYSNASRTQLFNIQTLQWDEKLCEIFEIPFQALPKVCMSDSVFGTTTFNGWLDHAIPICGVLGDSHASLLGHNCRAEGKAKVTYGTGSSVMMNTGKKVIKSSNGLVSSIAWGLNGKVSYVLEGNLNYTGAVISWLKNDIGLIVSDEESETLALSANPLDRTYFVPAFTGLAAPYWNSEATALFTGITRTTGKAEIVKACLDCIAYQITDLVNVMRKESGYPLKILFADGGPSKNRYLMQRQSDLSNAAIYATKIQELSGFGAAVAAGISCGLYNINDVYNGIEKDVFQNEMEERERLKLYNGWKEAIRKTL